MKTCLYNPVFINPQAYFVFPQLYAMQPKTDDLIEYAKYTGQLIVTDVTNNDTYTVYSRSNSIDLSDFAEKRIRISQYTNTGAVLLGEWNMPVGSCSVIHPNLIAAWSAAGKTNEDEDRAILKDLTGNGHDITLNGFAFSGMSGYGGYATNLYSYSSSRPSYATINKTYNTIEFVGTADNIGTTGAWMFYFKNKNLRKTKIELSYTNDSSSELTASIQYIHFDGTSNKNMFLKEGIIELPESIQGDVDKYYGILVTNSKVGDRITIKELPEYPDALVFDGVDDYGICKNMPIMTDHTLIFKYKLIQPKVDESFVIGKRFRNLNTEDKGAFHIAIYMNGSAMWIRNYGKQIYGYTYNDGVIYLTKYNFNGDTKIIAGTGVDTKLFSIGTTDFRGNDENSAIPELSRNTNMAFYCAYLFDRSLTEEEIKAFIRKNIDPDYLLPSEQQTTE